MGKFLKIILPDSKGILYSGKWGQEAPRSLPLVITPNWMAMHLLRGCELLKAVTSFYSAHCPRTRHRTRHTGGTRQIIIKGAVTTQGNNVTANLHG